MRRRLGVVAAIVVPVAVLAALVACTEERPVASGAVGEGFSVELKSAGNPALDITVDEVEPVSAATAREWDLRTFSDTDGSQAAELDFTLVRFTVEEADDDLDVAMIDAPNWVLVTDEGEYEGDIFMTADEADCVVSEDGTGPSCVALAVPAGETLTEVRFANVRNFGSVKHQTFNDGRFVAWTVD